MIPDRAAAHHWPRWYLEDPWNATLSTSQVNLLEQDLGKWHNIFILPECVFLENPRHC